MTIQAIPLPALGAHIGSEYLMEALGFSLNGRELLVRLTYLKDSDQRHAIWAYDLDHADYTLSLNALLATSLDDTSADIATIEAIDAQACMLNGAPALAVLYSVAGRDGQHLGVIQGGIVATTDIFQQLLPDGATLNVSSFAISQDGRFVAIQTTADLSSDSDKSMGIADENEAFDVYLLDRSTHTWTRVSMVEGDSLLTPSLLTTIAISNDVVQVGFISNGSFSSKDKNDASTAPGDAYVWSHSFNSGGLTGSPRLTLVSATATNASGGVTASSDGQGPEHPGPIVTTTGVYFNSTSAQLSNSDTNVSADAFIFSSGKVSPVVWSQQPYLDAGAVVVSTSLDGTIAALLSDSASVAGDYGANILLVVDTRTGAVKSVPGTGAAIGELLSATLSPSGTQVAFTLMSDTPLVSNEPLLGGTLYLADTGVSAGQDATGAPSITGTAAEGGTLGVDVSTITDPDGLFTSIAYAWQRSSDNIQWSDVDGAINASYVIASDQSEVGKYIRVVVTSTDAKGGISHLPSSSAKVVNVNDAPTARSFTFDATEDAPVSGDLSGVDVDGDAMTFATASAPSHGSLELNASTGAFVYKPAVNYTGIDSFTFLVSDGALTSAPATASINVSAVNDSPVLQQALVDCSVKEGQALELLIPSNSFADIDDNSLSFSARLANGQALPAWLQFDPGRRAFNIAPGNDVVGKTAQTFTVEVAASDAAGLQAVDSFDVAVQPFGYNIQASVAFWKPNANSQKAKLANVNLTKSGVSGTSSADAGIALSGVDDTEGPADGFMTLNPQAASPSNAKSAINLTDVLAALKLYLGKALPDSYASPLNYVAADFDGSGAVTLNDVLSMLKYYLGKSSAMPQWAFVDAADFTDQGRGFVSVNNQALSKNDALPHPIDQNFDAGHESIQILGVLRGDVDGSWTT